MQLLVHGMKVVERVLEKRLGRIVTVNQMQFRFVPGTKRIDAVFILRRLQQEHRSKGKKVVCVLLANRKL